MAELIQKKQQLCLLAAAGNLYLWSITAHSSGSSSPWWGQGGLRPHGSKVPPGLQGLMQALLILLNRNSVTLPQTRRSAIPQHKGKLPAASAPTPKGVREKSQTHHLLHGCLSSTARRLPQAHSQYKTRPVKSGLQGRFKSNLNGYL